MAQSDRRRELVSAACATQRGNPLRYAFKKAWQLGSLATAGLPMAARES